MLKLQGYRKLWPTTARKRGNVLTIKLHQITISNFKGITFAKFDPTSFGCLVGENNAGKSTVLHAIVLGLNRPTQLAAEMYYNPISPIVFTLDFTAVGQPDLLRLAEEHRGKIAELIDHGKFSITVTYAPGERCEVTTPRRQPIEPRYRIETISDFLKGKTGGAVRQAVLENFGEFGDVPDQLNITSAKAYLSGKIAELGPDAFELINGPLPSGINTSITRFLPEPIYIPAVKNLSDELKTTQSTSFGRLMGLLLDGMMPDLAEINRSLETLDALFNRVAIDGSVVDGRHVKVRDLESTVESFLGENFPSARVELSIPRPELKAILSAAQIYIDDGSRDLIDNKGDGIKRSLTFALLQAYVAQLNAAAEPIGDETPSPRPLIFLFEEPELYLHPKSQRVLFRTLARISETHQVVVTTHSPLFFEPGVTAAFVRVAKVHSVPKPIGVLYPIEFELNQDSAEAFRLAKFENAEAAFFSRRVVLLEGESDDAYCRHVARTLLPEWDFETKNIAIVRVSGKGNFAKFRRFFNSFGIDVKIIADLDALFDGFVHLGASEAAVAARAIVLQHLYARIAVLGVKPEPAARQIKAKVQQDGWNDKWEFAKTVVRQIQEGVQPDDAALARLVGLFDWEHDIARVKACREDPTCRQQLTGLLDQLRDEGLCVLSKGAIEDYYPNNAPHTGSKPERAIAACSLVLTLEVAASLSTPLALDREPELVEIFRQIFK